MGVFLLVMLLASAYGGGGGASSLPHGVHQGIYWRTVRVGKSYRVELWWDVGGHCAWAAYLCEGSEAMLTPEELAKPGSGGLNNSAMTLARACIEREWLQNMGGAMVAASCPPP